MKERDAIPARPKRAKPKRSGAKQTRPRRVQRKRKRFNFRVFLRNMLALLLNPFVWIFWLISRPYVWLAMFIGGYLRAAWAGTEKLRRKQRKRAISRLRIWRARLMTGLKFRRPPKEALVVPRFVPETENGEPQRRTSPLVVTTAISCVLMLAAAGYYVAFVNPLNDEQPGTVSLVALASETPTPTATPTETPTPTLTPSPTPIILQLTPWPTPDPLAGGGTIAFELRRNGNADLYALTVGSTEPVRLTSDLAPDKHPAWRPDGRMLAFTSQRDNNWDIYVLDLPTGEISRITTQPGYDGHPAWSPDGEWLIYESYQNDNFDLYLIKRDRSEGPIRLTENPAADFEPSWSPDGRSLVYTSLRTGSQDLFLMSLDDVGDSRAINLTNTFEVEERHAAFHPLGTFLSYTESIDGFDILKAIPLEDNLPIGEAISLGQGRQPAWAPLDDSLVYAHTINNRDFIIATTLGAWAVAPQTFTTEGRLASPVWSAVPLAPKPAGFLAEIAELPSIPLYTETISRTESFDPLYQLVSLEGTVEAPLPFLNSTIDQSFLALQGAIEAQSGQALLSGLDRMFEPLDAQPLPGEAAENWHKAGRAFDLQRNLVLAFDPIIEVLRRDEAGETFWEIFVRASVQDGSLGEPLREEPWDFRARFGDDPAYYDQGGRYKEKIPSGYYVNFTEIAQDHGWFPVPADPNWRTNYAGVRFWQFEKREGLSLEDAMQEIYSSDDLQVTNDE